MGVAIWLMIAYMLVIPAMLLFALRRLSIRYGGMANYGARKWLGNLYEPCRNTPRPPYIVLCACVTMKPQLTRSTSAQICPSTGGGASLRSCEGVVW